MFSPIAHPIKTFLAFFSRRQFFEPGGYAYIWRVAWPLILLSSSNSIMMLTNRVFLAKSSLEENAAAMPTGQMNFTLLAFFLITTGFTATIVAQSFGAGDKEGCVRATWNGLYFGAAVSLLMGLTLPFLGSWLILHNGHDPAIAAYEKEYFNAILPSNGFACIEAAILSFFNGRGRTFIVAAIKIGACVISVFFNYVLIFGKLNLPALGITGAGLAVSLTSLLSLLVSLLCFLMVDQQEFPTRRCREIRADYLKKLLFFGTPAGLQTFIRNAAFAGMIMMVGSLGKETLAAVGIALSINMIGTMPMIGLLDATSIITGQFIGKGRLKSAERVAGRSLRMLLAWMTLMALVYIFDPHLLIGLFSGGNPSGINFSDVQHKVIILLRWSVVLNIFDATRFITMGALRGAGDTQVPLFISMGTSWLIMVPSMVLAVYIFRVSIGWIWALLTFYLICDAALMVWRRRSGAWKHIRVIENARPPEAEETVAA